jgi:hypothetical protein
MSLLSWDHTSIFTISDISGSYYKRWEGHLCQAIDGWSQLFLGIQRDGSLTYESIHRELDEDKKTIEMSLDRGMEQEIKRAPAQPRRFYRQPHRQG